MELPYSLSPNWEPIPDLTKRWSRKPDADEVADAENSYSHWIQRVVTERWGHGSLDEDVPEAHSYYLVSEPEVTQSTLRIYYRHWEWGNPVTDRVSTLVKLGGGETPADVIFKDFMREKSLALIDFELRDEEYLQLSAEIHELELEEHSSLTFEFGDVTGYWVPFPWNIIDGRFYFFRGGHRITKSGEELAPESMDSEFPTTNFNHDICKRADAEKYFLELCRADKAD